ncbi:F-box domain containing protein [Pandoravirus salinus]|uniref:F-box domain containing protein n=1 Tax=Pandoravirus salinus TaxID=1349410 RepID=S4W3R2_9VIRU|nr:F-box domain [Pandoravirus salinus]AGO84935.1 F-box domain containing protein [Pandoravirus salinus]
MNRGDATTASQAPPAKKQKVNAAASTEHTPATASSTPSSSHHRGGTNAPMALDRLPIEILYEILSWLPGPVLAAAACTCRTVEAVARDDRLWEAAYRRDIAPTGPPAEHADYAAHGKDMRWLYGLMGAAPGRMREGPTGVLTGRLIGADGITRRSGEFSVLAGDGDPTLRLNGYGAIVTKDTGNGNGTDTLCTVQGRCFWGEFVGALTIQWLDASAYASGLAAARFYRGEVTRTGDTVAEGDAAAGRIRVLGGRALSGRCVSNVVVPGCIYAGKCDDGAPGACGAVRLPDGTVRQHWTQVPSGEEFNAHWGIERPSDGRALVTRVAYDIESDDVECDGAAIARVALATHSGLAARLPSRRRNRSDFEAMGDLGDGLFATGTCVRVSHAGHILVWIAAEAFFLAVAHHHADRRIAGLRILGRGPRIRAFLGLADGAQPSLDCLVALEDATADVVTKALSRVSALEDDNNGNGGDNDDSALLHGASLSDKHPFGIVIDDDGSGDGGSETINGDGDDSGSTCRHWVNCFLTGRRVKAAHCAFFATGRLYESRALRQWVEATDLWPSDPETGGSAQSNALDIAWAPWMASISSHLLGTIVAHTILSNQISYTPETRATADRAANDIVRLRLLQATGAIPNIPPRDIALVVKHAVSSWESRRSAVDDGGGGDLCNNRPKIDGAEAVRGFDLVSMRHIELVDPEWNLRGEWRGTMPCAPFDDPTLGQHERHLLDGVHVGGAADAAVRPDAHLDSHGVLRVPLGRASFVGAHLVGVFFFGHYFHEASFVGAVLDRCAFVGCTFHDCAMTAASVLHCGFWNCDRVVGSDTKPLTSRKVWKIIVVYGGLV